MGSEMCIRDSYEVVEFAPPGYGEELYYGVGDVFAAEGCGLVYAVVGDAHVAEAVGRGGYDAVLLLGVEAPLTLALALASIPSAVVHMYWIRGELRRLVRAREMVRIAARAVGNPYHALVREGLIREPEDLLSPEWRGFTRAATLGLWQILLHGGGRENLLELDDYISRILEFIRRLRAKTRVFLVYAVVEAAIVGAIYAVIMASGSILEDGGGWMAQTGITAVGIQELREWIDPILAITSLTLATATAGAREGKPHLLTTYLPLCAGSVWVAWRLSMAWAPTLFGW
mgnify:CR=1 FL=1